MVCIDKPRRNEVFSCSGRVMARNLTPEEEAEFLQEGWFELKGLLLQYERIYRKFALENRKWKESDSNNVPVEISELKEKCKNLLEEMKEHVPLDLEYPDNKTKEIREKVDRKLREMY